MPRRHAPSMPPSSSSPGATRLSWAGRLAAVETSAPADVIAYRRDDALVLVNTRGREARFTVAGFDVKGARNLLGRRPLPGDTLTLPGHGTAVLER